MNNDFFFDHQPTMDDFLHQAYEHSLPEEMIHNAVQRACAFFQMPEAVVVESMQTCEWSNNPYTYLDDVIGYNRDELKDMHIKSVDALTLIFTHEMTHRALQGIHNTLDPWTEESACDYMIGVNAVINHMDVSDVIESLGNTEGWLTHPTGKIRAEMILSGMAYAERLAQRGAVPTFDQCMQEFSLQMQEMAADFEIAKQSVFDEIARTEAARGANGVNSKEWNMKQARENMEWAEWHEKQAKIATDRGDFSSAQDHLSRAKSYQSKADDYKDAAKNSTNS